MSSLAENLAKISNPSSQPKKKPSFAERSAARQAALKSKWAQQRAETSGIEEESPARFWASFTEDLKAATAAAETAPDEAEVQRLEIECAEFRERVGKASCYLTPYDIRRATAEAKACGEKVAEARQRVAPKQKFGFGAGAFHKAEPAKPKEKRTAPEINVSKAANKGLETPGFRDEAGKVLVYEGGGQVQLEGLDDCIVFCAGALQALRMVKVTNCRIYAKSVAGPCYVIECSGCEIRVAPRQLRIHKTTGTSFRVQTASGPIIEHCEGVSFGPYAACWDGSAPDAADAAPETPFQIVKDAWKDVKDFQWLRSTPSPNFSILETCEPVEGEPQPEVPERARAEAAKLGLKLLPY